MIPKLLGPEKIYLENSRIVGFGEKKTHRNEKLSGSPKGNSQNTGSKGKILRKNPKLSGSKIKKTSKNEKLSGFPKSNSSIIRSKKKILRK